MPANKKNKTVSLAKAQGKTVNKRWNENRKGKQIAGGKNKPEAKKSKLKSADYLQRTTSHALKDSKEIIAASLEHFTGDYQAVSNALEVPVSILKKIEQSKDQAFTEDILKEVSRYYRKRVVVSDPLTGLLNRGAFILEVNQAIKKKQEFSVIFIDLDKFKPVNDTYGHKIGDKLLQSVGNRIKDCVPNTSKVCRLGGDEYCVLIPKEDIKNGSELFRNSIDAELKLPFYFDEVEEEIYISASLGVSRHPENGDTAEKLLEAADKGMYEDKRNSENEVNAQHDFLQEVRNQALYNFAYIFSWLVMITWGLASYFWG